MGMNTTQPNPTPAMFNGENPVNPDAFRVPMQYGDQSPYGAMDAGARPSAQRPYLLQATGLVMDYSADHAQSGGDQGTPAIGSMNPGYHTLALNHVDFALAAGESVAIMGPSGSGKSTLLHALAGIITPTSGTVSFRGTNLSTMSDKERTKLRRSAFGFVFQSGQLLPELPAVENIALPMMLGSMGYRQAVDTAVLWLERLGLRQLADQRPGEMSGGQMQRISIARALCVNPSIVFADEPTGALDQQTGHEVMGILMQSAQASGSSVVVVTHDPHVARFCKHIVTMRDGRLYSSTGQQHESDFHREYTGNVHQGGNR